MIGDNIFIVVYDFETNTSEVNTLRSWVDVDRDMMLRRDTLGRKLRYMMVGAFDTRKEAEEYILELQERENSEMVYQA